MNGINSSPHTHIHIKSKGWLGVMVKLLSLAHNFLRVNIKGKSLQNQHSHFSCVSRKCPP